jgi:hypothetical protein
MLDTSEPQRTELPFLNRVPILQLRGTCKAVPLQAWSDPEGSRKVRFPDFVYILLGHPFLKHGRQCESCEGIIDIVNER